MKNKNENKRSLLFIFYLFFLLASGGVMAQTKTVSGTIVDENSVSLPGVSVLVRGTTTGTTTDVNGNYTILVPGPEAVLEYSFVGFLSEQELVGERTTIDIVMMPSIEFLEEFVVVGYGTVRKVDLTGSVSSVSTEGFDRIPAANPLQALQGRASGLQITSESGIPGSGSEVLVRGVSSIRGTSSPIFVVDGVITTNIDNINPNNIESISVLKDAAAASIYGARASNGVILVTTKRGKTGKPTITYNAYVGAQTQGNLRVEQLNSTQFIDLLTEAYDNDEVEKKWNQEILDQFAGVNTDWNGLMLQTGMLQSHDVSVSGGSEKSNYFVSASHLGQSGMVIETGYQKSTFTLNTDHQINNWFKFGNSLNLFTSNQNLGGTTPTGISPYNYSLIKSPLTRAYEDNGDFGTIINTDLEHMHGNPVWMAKNSDNLIGRKGVQGSLYATINLLKGLNFTTRGSIDYRSAYSSIFTSGVPPRYGWEGSVINFASKEFRETTNWMTDFLLNYDTEIAGVHSINALLGYSLEESVTEDLFGSRSGTPNDLIRYLGAGDPTTQLNDNTFRDWAFASVFGRLNYNYKSKYLASFSVRRDGSSRLAGDNRYDIYPSGSLAWRISDEGFMQNLNWLDDLKIRASLGTLGNVQSVGLYATSASLAARRSVINQFPAAAYTFASAINANLRWENAVKRNVGLDFGAFNYKLYGSADVFIEDTYDLLFLDPIPPSTGLAGQPFINAGQVRNSGFEMELGFREKKTDWSYDISFNFSNVKNEVIDLDGRDLSTQGVIEGYPVNSFYGYMTDGLITSEDQLTIYTEGDFKQKRIGDIRVLDIDGYDENGELTGEPDGKVDAADRTIIGDRYPDFIYGAMGTVSYKGLSLQVQIQGVQGIDLYYGQTGAYSMVQLMTSWARNEDARLINRYHPENNPDGTWPLLSRGDKGRNLQRSDFWLEDASYVRINNINLSYDLPESLINMAAIEQISLYVSIQNAYTFTKYGGPEVDSSVDPLTGVPQPRSYTLGIKAMF
jgi:TonB-dependent starch-binding outer membrane protein SusC